MPTCFIVGGPNGIGKSTFSEAFSEIRRMPRIDPDFLYQTEFTNPDKSQFPYYLLLKAQGYLEESTSFIYESNLHSDEAFGIIDLVRQFGFSTNLIFICTDSLDLLEARVAERHKLGYHYVPVRIIIERYYNALQLLPKHLYRFDEVTFYDGTPEAPDQMINVASCSAKNIILNIEHLKTPRWFKAILDSLPSKPA